MITQRITSVLFGMLTRVLSMFAAISCVSLLGCSGSGSSESVGETQSQAVASCSGDCVTGDTTQGVDEGSLSSSWGTRKAWRACKLSRELQSGALAPPVGGADPSIEAGRQVFNDRALDGLHANGRGCADCHMASDSFQLSPANAKARFEALQLCRTVKPDADDPLFRPVDADDFVENGDKASDFSNLVDNGLIRIRFPLPANVKLVDPASCMTDGVPAPCQTATTYEVSKETFVDVWRSVPSVRNVSITGPDGLEPFWSREPNVAGGYQLDGRVDTLQNQALGAFRAHAQVQIDPPAASLDEVASFQTATLAPPEPKLDPDSLEEQGRTVFERACTQCHGGAGGTTPGFGLDISLGTGMQRYHDVSSACPQPVDTVNPPRWDFAAAALAAGRPAPCQESIARNARTFEFTFADGFKLRRTTTDLGRALLSGFIFSAPAPVPPATCEHPPCGPGPADDFQKFDVAPLHGISQTAPYFHNNSAETLEDVVIHYEEFFKRASALNPPETAPLTPVILTTGISCDDPKCPADTLCSADNLCRDRPNVPSERAALVAYLKTL